MDYTAPMQLNDYADTHPAGITQHSLVCLAGIYTQSCDRSCMPTEGLAHCRAHHAGKPDQFTLVIATVSIPLQGRHRATADLAPVVHTAHSFVAPSTAIHPHNHPSSHTGSVVAQSRPPRTDDHPSYRDIDHADHGQPH